MEEEEEDLSPVEYLGGVSEETQLTCQYRIFLGGQEVPTSRTGLYLASKVKPEKWAAVPSFQESKTTGHLFAICVYGNEGTGL